MLEEEFSCQTITDSEPQQRKLCTRAYTKPQWDRSALAYLGAITHSIAHLTGLSYGFWVI